MKIKLELDFRNICWVLSVDDSVVLTIASGGASLWEEKWDTWKDFTNMMVGSYLSYESDKEDWVMGTMEPKNGADQKVWAGISFQPGNGVKLQAGMSVVLLEGEAPQAAIKTILKTSADACQEFWEERMAPTSENPES